MANRKRCVNQTCQSLAQYYKAQLCRKHYDELGIRRQPRIERKPLQPTNLPEWEWIKKELNL